MTVYFDNKPKVIEAVGNGNHLYHWDIRTEQCPDPTGGEAKTTTQYVCNEVVIHGNVEFGKVVEAVIHNTYTTNQELALLNKYNAYQQGMHNDDTIIAEYETYLRFIGQTKAMVRKDLGEKPKITPEEATTPRMADVMNLMKLTINNMDLQGSDALSVKTLYPEWAVGLSVKVGEKYLFEGELWQVVQPHTTQDNWKPSIHTASLWKRIDETHQGTANDPIPYAPPMQIYNGKHYTQNGVKYYCNRDSGQPLTHNLSDLVGLYVTRA